MFKLRTEKGRQQVRRQIARADIDPGVLVDFAAEKPAPVRSLFPKNLGSLVKLCVIDQQRAAFCAEVSPAIAPLQTIRVIFDHSKATPARDSLSDHSIP